MTEIYGIKHLLFFSFSFFKRENVQLPPAVYVQSE